MPFKSAINRFPSVGSVDSCDVAAEVAVLWADALNRERVNPGDDFFALGGTIDKAARIAVRTSRRFRIALTTGDVLSARTPAGLSLHVRRRLSADVNVLYRLDASMTVGTVSTLSIWLRELGDRPDPFALPYARSTTATGSRASVTRQLPTESLTAIERYAQREAVDRRAIALAVFRTLLLRDTGRDDLVLGMSFGASPLPLRLQLDGAADFRTAITRAQRTLIETHERSDIDPITLRDALEAREPLFPVTFDVGPAPIETPLAVRLDGETLTLDFDTAIYTTESIERLAGRFVTLLDSGLADPRQPLAELPVLTPAEWAELEAFNANDRDFPSETTLHALLEAQASRTPNGLALTSDAGNLTFHELHARANQLAHHLHTLGVGPNVFVGVCVDRTPEAVVAMLGILKSGGAYIPLDPAFPADRLALYVTDSAMPVVIVSDHLRDRLPASISAQTLSPTDPAIANHSTETPSATAGPNDLAYVLYTSGSTGVPNGVAVHHRAIVNQMHAMADTPGLTGDDVVIALTTFSFDIHTLEIWLPLYVGAKIVLVTRETSMDGARLLERMQSANATMMQATPVTWRLLIAAGWSHTPQLKCLVGGEPLPIDLAGQILTRAGQLWNMYGPTETAVWSHVQRIETAEPPILVGKAVMNYRTYILDANMHAVPVGCIGEIWIGGVGVCRYLNRPELNAARFRDNPFRSGERIYKSGDMGRFTPDGAVECLGRADSQVKVRGYRIELGEVERAIADVPSIAEACVIARKDPAGADTLHAYFRTDAGTDAPLPSALRKLVRRRLPDYMTPASFTHLAAFPLTPNGKIDRKKLPTPTDDAFGREATEAARTPTEATIAELWSKALSVPTVGRTDNFFELGGHSLQAAKLIASMQETFGIELRLPTLFDRPTVAQLAETVSETQATQQTGPKLAHRPELTDRAPASLVQQRFWVLDQTLPDPTVYNVAETVKIDGPLDLDGLCSAWDAVVAAQPSLRTRFIVADGSPIQVVDANCQIPLDRIDFTRFPADDRLDAVRRWIASDARQPFDLAVGPLARAAILTLGNTDHRLHWTIHHIVMDEPSRQILLQALWTAYDRVKSGQSPTTAEPTVRYLDYAVWQQERLTEATIAPQLAWWTEHLRDAPPAWTLPQAKPRPAMRTYAGATHRFRFPERISDKLKAAAKKAGTTPFIACLAAFRAVLGRYGAPADIAIGTPLSARTEPAIAELVGCFVNTLALRPNLENATTFRSVMERVRTALTGAFAHAEVPFERIVEALRPERVPGGNPFIEMMFVYQNEALSGSANGLTWCDDYVELVGSKFDLTLFVEDRPGAMNGILEYATDLFDVDTIQRFAGHYLTLLEAGLDAIDAPLGSLTLLPADEYDRVVRQWNATDGAYPVHERIHGFFETQSALTPQAIALNTCTGPVTYADLEARANRLANALIARGVRPGQYVGVCLARTSRMVEAVFAVLKAGGAYVPLDASYPADRLGFMIEDSACPLVLTETAMLDRLPSAPANVEYVKLDLLDVSPFSSTRPTCPATPDDIAYAIYTSGSTGQPKGVVLRHRAVTNVLDWVNSRLPVTPDDRLLFVTSLSFDLSVYDIFGTLGTGASVRIASESELRDPQQLLSILTTEKITIWDSAPAALQQLVPFLKSRMARSLRWVMLSGDWIPVRMPDQLRDAFPGCRVLSLGGATEAAIWSNSYEVVGAVPPEWTSIPYGRPIRNAQYRILDAAMQPVPPGVPGELYIGGLVLADGYLNRESLTAERFVSDPFRADNRLYRTGDLARFDAEGLMEFLGRIDAQVKVRGYRVEIGEIESVLAAHPAVAAVAVQPHRDAQKLVTLVAYVVPKDGASLDGLTAYLRGKLPEYMVPATFVTLGALPVTPNGKLDRKALLPPKVRSGTGETFSEAPRGSTEYAVAELWREVLGVPQAGRNDNFFAFGGHSLKGVQLIAKLQDRFGVRLRLPVLFDHPTIAGLAEAIGKAERSLAADGLRRSDPDLPTPTSPIQQRFWIVDRTVTDRCAYNVPDAYRLRGPLNSMALEQAWNAVLARQETLRTTYREMDGVPMQRIRDFQPMRLQTIDFTKEPADARETLARQWLYAEARKPIDLEAGPVTRAHLLKLGPTEHLFATTIHHIAMDESSRGVLVRDLWQAYGQALAGKSAELPSLALRYADFAVRSYMDASHPDAYAADRAFWAETLAEVPLPETFPAVKPVPTPRTEGGAMYVRQVPAALVGGLQNASKLLGATPFLLGLTLFKTLLFRYVGRTDLVVGTAASTRPGDLPEPVGCFVNTLPLRTRFTASIPFRDLLETVRASVNGAFAHAEMPYEAIVRSAAPVSQPGEAAFFRTLFVHQCEHLQGPTHGGLWWQLDHVEHVGSKFDLTLTLDDRPDRMSVIVEYATDLYDADSIARLVGHFFTLWSDALARPDRAIDRLALLPPGEYEKIVNAWNATDGPYPAHECIHGFFEKTASRTPDAIALRLSEGRTVSYSALEDRANRIAHGLRAKGIRRGELVGVYLTRGVGMIEAVLGILKAGGAYVPFDASYPTDRLAFMLADTAVRFVITEASVRDRLPGDTTAELIDLPSWNVSDYPASRPNRIAGPEDIAYVIYTSGSTGQPKGVVLRHRAVTNVLDWVNSRLPVTPDDRLLFVTSLSFDLSVYDIFGTLGVGASVRIASESELRDPQQLLNILTTEKITIWDSAPAALQQLVPFLKSRMARSLRWVMLSGDWIPVRMPDQLRDAFPGCRVLSLGGATEAAIWSNSYEVVGAVPPEWTSIPYGRPIRNAQYRILDAAMQPVPPGVPGELYIGGLVLADGYLNRESLTAERFVSDPFRADNRLYRTGDLARFDAEGLMEFLGRIDAQVKVRGYRVEIGEIESVLAAHPAVAAVAVQPHRDAQKLVTLVAYVVPQDGASLDGLTAYLRGKLPEYMVPATFVTLGALPVTPNGKLDRKALLPPTDAPHRTNSEAPHGKVEELIATIWKDILDLAEVGRHDNFFAVGGHSLKGARLIARVQEKFGVRLRLPVLFDYPTIAGLAEAIGRASKSEEQTLVGRSGFSPEPRRAPASLVQQRFWFLDRTIPDRTVYNVPDTIRLTGTLNIEAFQAAWNALLVRQAGMRTTFVESDGLPVQVIAPHTLVRLPFIDLAGLTVDARDAEVVQLIAEEARTPFDLENGPIYRARIVKLASDEHLFQFTAHHIIMDESSRMVLYKDLWQSYGQILAGQSADLPPLEVRYADYALWQRNKLQGEKLDADLSFWKTTLQGAPPPLTVPTIASRSPTPTYAGKMTAFPIQKNLAEAMRSFSRDASVTPFITCLAVFDALMHRYTGQTDLIVGTAASARPTGPAADILGCFVNTLALRTDVSGEPTFRELLRRVRDTLTHAFEHADIPFERIVEEVRPERVPGGHPFFQVMFDYQNEQLQGIAAGGLGWVLDHCEHVGSKFDLTMTIDDRPGHVALLVEYSTDLYDSKQISRIAQHYMKLLEAVTSEPDRPIADFDLLPAAEREQVLYRWNATEGDYRKHFCVHQLVEMQAERTPDAIAFVCDGKTLNYRDLNEKANRLAHQLRAMGVGPDVLVGLSVERSLDAPVGLLGILKAGGAYVPLDPDFPPDRLAYYVRDAQMPVLVGQEKTIARLALNDIPAVRLDADVGLLAQQPITNPANLSRPEHLCYILYTSGSTGQPNGVMIEHRNLVNLLESYDRVPGIARTDAILQLTTLSFDIHTIETWWPMVNGAKSIIVPREVALDGRRLGELAEQSGVTIMQATPATWRLLLMAGWKGKADVRAFSGGEPLTHELIRQLTSRVDQLWNMYGPTETTVYSTVRHVHPDDGLILIGTPVLNTQCYILDAKRLPVPIGCIGELYIAGDGVGRGYRGREELTAKRFMSDPFRKNNRMYKTGDLARYLPDGNIECLGRVDHQVKVRGFRIELGEIERALERHSEIGQAVVIARKDPQGLDQLHAYFRPKNAVFVTPEQLRAHLVGKLPDYMIPATFTGMSNLPTTPNGKVDRKALPSPTADAAARGTSGSKELVLPANDAERELLAIWEDVLKVKPIGVTDDFTQLGGHSLMAAVLMARIESKLGYRIPLEALFNAPTVRGMADLVQKKLELSGGVLVPLRTTGTKPALIMIAGVGGHVFAFHQFARLLGEDYPVYGMKAVGVDGTEPPPERFEQIALRYRTEIETAYPEGPIVICGYSIGSRVGLELAMQLQRAGRDVRGLVALDAIAPGFPKMLPMYRRAGIHTMKFMRMPFGEKAEYVSERYRNVRRKIRFKMNRHHLDAPPVPGLEAMSQEILNKVWATLTRGSELYHPESILRAPITLIQSTRMPEWLDVAEPMPSYGWDHFTDRPVELQHIDAEHMDFFHDEAVLTLAQQIRGIIDRAARRVEG